MNVSNIGRGEGGSEGRGMSGSGRPRESSVPRRVCVCVCACVCVRVCVCGRAAQGSRVVVVPRQRRAGPRQADRGPASARVKSVQFYSFSSSVSFITQRRAGPRQVDRGPAVRVECLARG